VLVVVTLFTRSVTFPHTLLRNVTGRESEATTLFASANQAVSDAVTSIRVVQAYNLQKHVSLSGGCSRIQQGDEQGFRLLLLFTMIGCWVCHAGRHTTPMIAVSVVGGGDGLWAVPCSMLAP
jgi:hypothetical protein